MTPTPLQLSKADLAEIAAMVVKELEPLIRFRIKKQLRPANAALLYDSSPDFLAKQTVDLLPRIQIGKRFTAYRVDDLDNFFSRYLIRG